MDVHVYIRYTHIDIPMHIIMYKYGFVFTHVYANICRDTHLCSFSFRIPKVPYNDSLGSL